MTRYLSSSEIDAVRPMGRTFAGPDQRVPLRASLEAAGEFGPNQTAGRFYPMACVALEITQRCNLDCTLCYLSEHAEAAHDVPLPILISRIAMVESHYGPGTSIQITGGDPTLRRTEDLELLCREIRQRGMRSCLMTNGIRATREMLTRLAAAGLDDVAFHVDLTQERKGYATEAELNAIRETYIERACGLGLRILFNTTVFDGNLDEVPLLASFFRDHADTITLASFQLQAETGRGVMGTREDCVSQASVMARLSDGAGTPLDFDSAMIGHRDCNRYASLVVAGSSSISATGGTPLFARLLPALEAAEQRHDGHTDILWTGLRLAVLRPGLAARLVGHALGRLWRLRRGLVESRGAVHRIAFLVHNFMDADRLDAERCASCVFMVMTEGGPLSMCVHNARRDHHLFTPAQIADETGKTWWSAATGEVTDRPVRAAPAALPAKLRKGRGRAGPETASQRT